MNSDEGGAPTTSRPFERVGIVGLGLMGGSLARGLKGSPNPPSVSALSLRLEDLERARASRIIDQGFSRPEGFFSGLDLVVYCTPLDTTLTLLGKHRDLLEDGTLVTDVVSLKVPLMQKVREVGIGTHFVGSHPFAGGEGEGFSASRDELFKGARVWLVAGDAPLDHVNRVEEFWSNLEAAPRVITADRHDALMVWISHLPQLTSNALALALHQAGHRREALGPGGWDVTRLAGSNPEMWADLLEHAPTDLQEALKAVEDYLAEFRSHLAAANSGRVAEQMERTRTWSRGSAE